MRNHEETKSKAVGIICTEVLSCMFWILLILACCNRDPITAIKVIAMQSLLYTLRRIEFGR